MKYFENWRFFFLKCALKSVTNFGKLDWLVFRHVIRPATRSVQFSREISIFLSRLNHGTKNLTIQCSGLYKRPAYSERYLCVIIHFFSIMIPCFHNQTFFSFSSLDLMKGLHFKFSKTFLKSTQYKQLVPNSLQFTY